MANVQLTNEATKALFDTIRGVLPKIPLTHLRAALAVGAGFRSDWAMREAIKERTGSSFAFDQAAFTERLIALGHAQHFSELVGADESKLAKSEIAFRTMRDRAWRNLLVFALNEAIIQGLLPKISTEPSGPLVGTGWARYFSFTLPSGTPAQGLVTDSGWDEVRIQAVVNPSETGTCTFDGISSGEAMADSWMERRDGAWLQVPSQKTFTCGPKLMLSLGSMKVHSIGYQDRGVYLH